MAAGDIVRISEEARLGIVMQRGNGESIRGIGARDVIFVIIAESVPIRVCEWIDGESVEILHAPPVWQAVGGGVAGGLDDVPTVVRHPATRGFAN